MRHGLLPALSLFLQPWLFFFFNTAATGISLGLGRGVGTRLSAAWWQFIHTINPIILKPIEWRIMVSCRYNASMKPHPRASFRSLGYFLILLPSASVVFLVSSFCGAREGTREGKRRRVCSRNFCLRPKKTAPAPCKQSPFHSSWGMIGDRGRPPLPRFYIKKSSKWLC